MFSSNSREPWKLQCYFPTNSNDSSGGTIRFFQNKCEHCVSQYTPDELYCSRWWSSQNYQRHHKGLTPYRRGGICCTTATSLLKPTTKKKKTTTTKGMINSRAIRKFSLSKNISKCCKMSTIYNVWERWYHLCADISLYIWAKFSSGVGHVYAKRRALWPLLCKTFF